MRNDQQHAYILAFARAYHQLPVGPPTPAAPVPLTFYDLARKHP